MRVFNTSSGVVRPAAMAPATLPKRAEARTETGGGGSGCDCGSRFPCAFAFAFAFGLGFFDGTVRCCSLYVEYEVFMYSHSVNWMTVKGISRIIVTPAPR